MTYAPADLLAVRRYLLQATGLSGDAVGIVGDPAHAATGGYHEGNDDLARVGRLLSDYSKRESARDRPGSNAASALDIGSWTGRRGKRQITWLDFNAAWLDACRRNDPRCRDQRELIYTLDGKIVKRWDRLGLRTAGDSSHLYHTHGSLFRDSEGRRDDADNLMGLFRAIFEGDDMPGYGYPDAVMPEAEAYRVDALMAGSETVRGGPFAGETMALVVDVHKIKGDVAAIKAQLATGGVDPAALVEAFMAALQGPAVRAMLVEAARAGAELAEDS